LGHPGSVVGGYAKVSYKGRGRRERGGRGYWSQCTANAPVDPRSLVGDTQDKMVMLE